MKLKLKRVYEQAGAADGLRILVDRLWPRGLTKEAARVDLWLKEAAPSPALRQWFNHEPDKWEPFRAHYLDELRQHPEKTAPIRECAGKGTVVTLLYGAKDEKHNHARVLKEFLQSGAGQHGKSP